MKRKFWCLPVVVVCCWGSVAVAQVPFLGMGDSIGEGVQSADASEWTQPFSYLNLIALRAGVAFPLPLIRSGPLGAVGNTNTRSRIDPAVAGRNLSVNGADTFSLLNDRANAADPSQFDSETDMVLFPRVGSQIEIAETLHPDLAAVWIGNNDALGAVTAFDQLDASQLTPVPEFIANFSQIAARLKAQNSRVVFGTIPDVSRIGFLMDRTDLLEIFGNDLGLPATSRTTFVAVLLIGLGLAPPSLVQDPHYVLDASEMAAISQRIATFNAVIQGAAQFFGFGVADIHARFNEFAVNPPVFNGVPLTNRYLGGLFSLDGVHPSNIAHALVANEFIARFNGTYGTAIAPLDAAVLNYFFVTDPFVDLNLNGRVRGRPLAGLLEVLSAVLGFSGDNESFAAEAGPDGEGEGVVFAASSASRSAIRFTPERNRKFMDEYRKAKGKDLTRASRQEVNAAFRELFGLDRNSKKSGKK